MAAVAVGVCLAWAGPGRADEIHTTDGSRLVGTIQRWTTEKLVIETKIAGTLEIARSDIVAIATESPVTVRFESGDRLVGTMTVSPDLKTTTIKTALGEMEVSSEQISAVWPEGAESPEMIALREDLKASQEALKPDWTVTFEGSAVMKEGNTDRIDARARFDAKRRTDMDLLHFYAQVLYAEDNDVRSQNEYIAGTRYRNDISDRWYWYLRSELEYDEFENLDLRATVTGGGGYFWIKKPEQELATSVGAGYRHESYSDSRSEDSAILDLGLNYRLDIADWAQFTHETIYSPDVEEFSDYRITADTALVFPFKNDRWKWKMGIRNEYNSNPDPGLDRLDNTYYTSLVLELK
jgi:putative salt-induced outer membrane protein YdiY